MTFICRDGLHRHCDGLVVDQDAVGIRTERCDCRCHVPVTSTAGHQERVPALA